MFVQIVTYNLSGVSEQDYIDIAHQVAPQFSAMGGLLAKVWLRDPDANVFGAVYFWEDQESQERFTASDLYEGTYPGFASVGSEGYEVYDQLTRATQPVLEIVEDEAPGWAPPPPPSVEPVEEVELMDEEPELLEPEELVEEPLELEELEPEELEPEEFEPEELVVAEPEPVVRRTRSRVVKRAPTRKAPAKKAPARKAVKAAKSTKVIKVSKKALPARRVVTTRAPRVTKVTKVTKKVGKRPGKAGAKRVQKLR